MPRIQEFIIYTFLRIPSSSLLRTKFINYKSRQRLIT